MQYNTDDYSFITSNEQLAEFAQQHQSVEWLCFDTEFMGEKRFVTLLCLVQIASENGCFLIDPFKVTDFDPLLKLLQDEHITKITHAGENDFRLFKNLYGITPRNIFDTQVAAGFVGYKYPVSFQKLVGNELGISVKKGYTVTDWSKRPMAAKQIQYALNDVVYLYDLWQKLVKKATALDRAWWIIEECQTFEKEEYYQQSPFKEAFNSNIIRSLKEKQQVFLIRLYDWRTKIAKRRNHSRDMVLPNKYIGSIVRAIGGGKEALMANRRLPEKLMRRHGDELEALFKAPPTSEEAEALRNMPGEKSEDPRQDVINEMLHLLIKYKCMEEDLSINLAMPRTMLKRLKADPDYFEDDLENGWRKFFLGKELIQWLKHRNDLKLVFGDGKFELILEEEGGRNEA